MKILSRYVLREFLVPLFYCMTGFVMIYVLFDLFGSFSRMAEAKVSLSSAAMYFCGYLAPYFHYIAPAALMLATLYTMWSFCRHSELVAMRAGGVSFLSISAPILAVAALVAASVAFVNESFVPRRSAWASQMKNCQFDVAKIERTDNMVYRNADDSRTWQIGSVLDEKAERLGDVRVSVDRPNGGARLMVVAAERADYLDGEWWFANPRVQHYDELGVETSTPTPELDALKLRSFPEFREQPSDFVLQNRPWKFNSVRDRLRYLRAHRSIDRERRRDYVYDVWAQAASPLACIVITLFAIPYGIATGRQSVFRGVLCALGMYFSFYGLAILMMVCAKNGWFPVVPAVFLPHAVFLAWGIFAFRRQR